MQINDLRTLAEQRSIRGYDESRDLQELIHFEIYDMNKFRDDQGMTSFIMSRTLQGAYGKRGVGDNSKAKASLGVNQKPS